MDTKNECENRAKDRIIFCSDNCQFVCVIGRRQTMSFALLGPAIFYMALEKREDLIKGVYCLDLSGKPYMTDDTVPDSVKTL